MTPRVSLRCDLPGGSGAAPVFFEAEGEYPAPLWRGQLGDGRTVLCQRLASPARQGFTAFVAIVDVEGTTSLKLEVPHDSEAAGMRELPKRFEDGFVRLDTGKFDLELCRGTAQGVGGSKWGLRHFRSLADGFELLPSGNNAIGGFYGPFFTPENGLINPPEHTTVEIETVEKGPLLRHYRMRGAIPDGLRDELKGKTFRIDWKFFYGCDYFERRYDVDPFQTVINGRSVTDKITVGDEFEGGPGRLVFDRFDAEGGARYRAGDPYAGELVAMVAETVKDSRADGAKMEAFRAQLADMESAHWDLYWRLFCAWEKALSPEEIRARLARVRAAAHRKADLPERAWIIANSAVDVSATPDETIFPGPAAKTAEFDSQSGRAMVWWTSQPSGAFQIVQRRQSGWVNWGTNGENECPELPVGAIIRTAYGHYGERWREIADRLESPPAAV